MGQSDASFDKKTISAIIITKNEEGMIANALSALSFADERIVVDSGSTDNTVEIAEREGALIMKAKSGSFSDWRNEGLKAAQGDWILYVDADERVTPKLAKEIEETVRFTSNTSFALRRNNIHFGKWMRYGGWQQDSLVRLFQRSALKRFEGDIHEHAVVEGAQGELKEPLVHLTHRNLSDGLKKSISWIDIEARLLLDAQAPKATPFTLIRKTMMEFLRRLLFKKGYKDGMEGWIESMQQAMNRFFVYERLWELQQKPPLEERYQRFEKEIQKLWKN